MKIEKCPISFKARIVLGDPPKKYKKIKLLNTNTKLESLPKFKSLNWNFFVKFIKKLSIQVKMPS